MQPALSDPVALLESLDTRVAQHYQQTGRPFVTLTYAQSLDGCIAATPGSPMEISGPESMRFTHELRALHKAILVGVGTVLSDDPALTTRLVDGTNAIPVILDSKLRIPIQSKVLDSPCAPVIATTVGRDAAKKEQLRARGARLYELPADEWGLVAISSLLDQLGQDGIESVMVEGGGRVITRFIDTKTVDRFIVTLSFMMVGGVPVLESQLRPPMHVNGDNAGNVPGVPRLKEVEMHWAGQDLILHANPCWGA